MKRKWKVVEIAILSQKKRRMFASLPKQTFVITKILPIAISQFPKVR